MFDVKRRFMIQTEFRNFRNMSELHLSNQLICFQFFKFTINSSKKSSSNMKMNLSKFQIKIVNIDDITFKFGKVI